MAVTPPTAPTPPTPPAVPKVTMDGGGSVTQSTVPQNKNQTDAQRQEADARQAVARGDGPLSKTTQEKPDAGQKQGQDNGQQNPGTTVVQTDPQAAAAMQDGNAGKETQNTQTATESAPPLSSFASHGAGYWIFTFLSVFVLAFVLFRVVMKKRDGSRGELSAEDIRRAIEPEEREEVWNLRGLTPDEALRQLEEKEALDAAAEIRKARKEAKERLERARRGMQRQPEVPASSAPKQIARQYREQVAAMPPEIKAKPKKIVRKPPKDDEDKEHFEISV